MSCLSVKQPLPKEEEKELKQTLQDLLGKGKIVKLEQKVCLLCNNWYWWLRERYLGNWRIISIKKNGHHKLKILIPS
jgi:hypothetical protein